MKILFATIISILFVQCKSPNATADRASIPPCVQQKIDSIKSLPRWNPPATVEEYRYNGKKVFLFSANCCDQYSTLLNTNCEVICAPSGGLTGKGDGLCPDFSDKAKLVRVVWKDMRTD